MKVRNLRKQHQLSLGIALILAGGLAFAHTPQDVQRSKPVTAGDMPHSAPVVEPTAELLFNVRRKKDGMLMATNVSAVWAEHMVDKAKSAKKAALEMVPA